MAKRSLETEAALNVLKEHEAMLKEAAKAKATVPYMMEQVDMATLARRFERLGPDGRMQLLQGMPERTKRTLAEHLARGQGQR